MNKTILLDIDIPLCRSDKTWWKWLEMVTETKMTGNAWDLMASPYDLTEFFKGALKANGMTGYEYWYADNVYDHHYMEPTEGSVEACEELSKMGYTLLPVSKYKGLHSASKQRWMDKHFPMCEPAIMVSDKDNASKAHVRGDYIVDDRACEISKFGVGTKGVVFKTPYLDLKDVEDITIPYVVMDNWADILKYFKQEERCYARD